MAVWFSVAGRSCPSSRLNTFDYNRAEIKRMQDWDAEKQGMAFAWFAARSTIGSKDAARVQVVEESRARLPVVKVRQSSRPDVNTGDANPAPDLGLAGTSRSGWQGLQIIVLCMRVIAQPPWIRANSWHFAARPRFSRYCKEMSWTSRYVAESISWQCGMHQYAPTEREGDPHLARLCGQCWRFNAGLGWK